MIKSRPIGCVHCTAVTLQALWRGALHCCDGSGAVEGCTERIWRCSGRGAVEGCTALIWRCSAVEGYTALSWLCGGVHCTVVTLLALWRRALHVVTPQRCGWMYCIVVTLQRCVVVHCTVVTLLTLWRRAVHCCDAAALWRGASREWTSCYKCWLGTVVLSLMIILF